jgi:hypothetical protein
MIRTAFRSDSRPGLSAPIVGTQSENYLSGVKFKHVAPRTAAAGAAPRPGTAESGVARKRRRDVEVDHCSRVKYEFLLHVRGTWAGSTALGWGTPRARTSMSGLVTGTPPAGDFAESGNFRGAFGAPAPAFPVLDGRNGGPDPFGRDGRSGQFRLPRAPVKGSGRSGSDSDGSERPNLTRELLVTNYFRGVRNGAYWRP